MSERSELLHYVAFFAAQRRSAYWCAVATRVLSPSYNRIVHQ